MIKEPNIGVRKRHLGASRIAAACLALGLVEGARAGPPFLTDDPEPVDLNHWEAYVFAQGDRTFGTDSFVGPAIELNYGIAEDTQIHLIAPVANVSSPVTGWTSGYGDTELGIKYRFIGESDSFPQVGIFPLAELPTGDASKGLGNGRTWYQLPIWAQKSWGPWTTYGGGGVALNSAPGQRNHGFSGWLLQRDIGKYVTLGGELFWQGASMVGERDSTIANVGGYLKISDSFNLLFSGGRSVAGERHTVWYLGLYWTGGPAKSGKK
jgi:hypothetical protein